MLRRNMNQEVLSAQAQIPGLPCVLVLAAGGERFRASGGNTHKLQAMLGDRTVLQTTIAAVQASGLPWHVEYGPHSGMGESIAAAVRATSHANGWLVLPADLPLIQARTLQALAAQLGQLDPDLLQVIQPFYQAQKATLWPLLAALQALSALCGDLGASSVVKAAAQSQTLKRWDCDDLGCVLDVDTVSALEQARQLWRQRLQGV